MMAMMLMLIKTTKSANVNVKQKGGRQLAESQRERGRRSVPGREGTSR